MHNKIQYDHHEHLIWFALLLSLFHNLALPLILEAASKSGSVYFSVTKYTHFTWEITVLALAVHNLLKRLSII
jgi:hypothetical protein